VLAVLAGMALRSFFFFVVSGREGGVEAILRVF